MVPLQGLPCEKQLRHDGKDNETDDFLYYFQLDKIERTSIVYKSYAVGRYLTAVFKEGYAPRKGNDCNQRPVAGYSRLVESEVSVPGKSHEDVAQYEKYDSI